MSEANLAEAATALPAGGGRVPSPLKLLRHDRFAAHLGVDQVVAVGLHGHARVAAQLDGAVADQAPAVRIVEVDLIAVDAHEHVVGARRRLVECERAADERAGERWNSADKLASSSTGR